MDQLLTLARRLYTRRRTGVVVPYKVIDVNYREFDCHQNAGSCARDNPGCKVVHGWLVFDFEAASLGLVSLVNFNPHSIIETADGERYDVTPSRASQRYPFIDHEGDTESFVSIVRDNCLSILSYDPTEDIYHVQRRVAP